MRGKSALTNPASQASRGSKAIRGPSGLPAHLEPLASRYLKEQKRVMFEHRADPDGLDDDDRQHLYERVAVILRGEGVTAATADVVEKIAQRSRNSPEERRDFITRLSPAGHAHLSQVAKALGITNLKAADDAIFGFYGEPS